MRRLHAVSATIFLSLIFGTSGAAGPAAPATEAEALERAQQTARRLAQTVFAELVDALGEKTPESAVSVCHDAAQRLTEEVAAREGIAVRRTTLRLRNEKNAPDAFERAILEEWAAGKGTPQPRHAVVETADGGRELRLLQPILVQQMCLTCHGSVDQVPVGVRSRIAELYPDDQASGFKAGDLRGAISVRVPMAP